MSLKPGDTVHCWTILKRSFIPVPGRFKMWTCRCICGTIRDVRGTYLEKGQSHSCGCLAKELIRQKVSIHGDSGFNNKTSKTETKRHYLYSLWSGIQQRTSNMSNNAWNRYGGRGIRMYEPWLQDYLTFKEWILQNLGERPPGMSLDRINNNGNYEPGNLRWATPKQQSENRRR